MMAFNTIKENIRLAERIEKEYLALYPHIKSWSISKIDGDKKTTIHLKIGKAKGVDYKFDLLELLDLKGPVDRIPFEKIKEALSLHNAKGPGYFETFLIE